MLLIRFIKLRQNGIPSFDIWTGQSITSAPSKIAFSYAEPVQPGKFPLAPFFEMTNRSTRTEKGEGHKLILIF